MALTKPKDFLRKMKFFVKKTFISKMNEGVGLDTQGKRSKSFLESTGTGPDRSFRCKQDSRGFDSLNTVTLKLLLCLSGFSPELPVFTGVV